MKFNFEISKLASKDLADIWEYTAEQWSNQQGNKNLQGNFSTINKICNNSEQGKPIIHIKQGHRKINVKSYIIVYKISRDIIYIDQILYHKMDIKKHLNE